MAEAYLGEIRMFPYNFVPANWAICAGQLLSIAQNSALFTVVGTSYGGDGESTFALPDLRSRVAISSGQGNGLSNYIVGQRGGTESVALDEAQLPSHSHAVNAHNTAGGRKTPAGSVPARAATDDYSAVPDGTTVMNAGMIGASGGGEPVSVIQPYLTIEFCIALTGIFPSPS